MKIIHYLTVIICLISQSFTRNNVGIDSTESIPVFVEKQITGEIKHTVNYTDSIGRHFLVLTRQHLIDSTNKKTLVLKAFQFNNINSVWKQEWIIQDSIECYHVDIDGNFFYDLISITDLNKDNIFETTIPYYLICSGGIEPKLTKVILKQEENKFTAKGESLIKIDENNTYGGTYQIDKELEHVPQYKKHIIETWKKAAGIE